MKWLKPCIWTSTNTNPTVQRVLELLEFLPAENVSSAPCPLLPVLWSWQRRGSEPASTCKWAPAQAASGNFLPHTPRHVEREAGAAVARKMTANVCLRSFYVMFPPNNLSACRFQTRRWSGSRQMLLFPPWKIFLNSQIYLNLAASRHELLYKTRSSCPQALLINTVAQILSLAM